MIEKIARLFERRVFEPRVVIDEPVGLDPRSKITVDRLSSRPGKYLLYLDTSNVRPGDTVVVTISVRPGPESNLLSALRQTIAPGEQIYWVSVGPCAGMELCFEMKSGLPVVIGLTIWKEA